MIKVLSIPEINIRAWKKIVGNIISKVDINDSMETQIWAFALYINLYQLIIYAWWLMNINLMTDDLKKHFGINPQLHNQSNLDDDLRGNLNIHKVDKLSISSNTWESSDISCLKNWSIPNKVSIEQSENVQKDKESLCKVEDREYIPFSKDEVWDQCCIKYSSSFLNKILIKSCSWALHEDCRPIDWGKINLDYKIK